MKIYNTKHVLTKGIIEQEAVETDNPDIVKVGDDLLFGDGREWHLTMESAIIYAESARDKKVLSLRRQADRIEKYDFNVYRMKKMQKFVD